MPRAEVVPPAPQTVPGARSGLFSPFPPLVPKPPASPGSADEPRMPAAAPLESPQDAHRTRSTAPTAPPAAQAEPVAGAPVTVEVHIGRIEVRAAPPPAPRRAVTARPAISLDDYLRRRAGEKT